MSFKSDEKLVESEEQPDIKTERTKPCNRTCIHQGDRICYNDVSGRETLQKITPSDTASVSESNDSIHSGESLFKNFIFNDDAPNLEKCMNFWQEILAKNIKPARCRVVKAKKEAQKPKPCPASPKCLEVDNKAWLHMYEELQKRKLDKIRLVKKVTCEPCEEYVDKDEEKRQEVEEIKKLNQWSPKSKKTAGKSHDPKRRLSRFLSRKSVSHHRVLSPKDETSAKIPTRPPKNTPMSTKSNSPFRLALIQKQTDNTEEISEAETTLSDKTDEKNVPTNEYKEAQTCCRCGCKTPGCICQDEKDCCGCEIKDCECDNVEQITDCCGCKLQDCCCQILGKVECFCGCNLEDCICQDLMSKSCKCGKKDCNCDAIDLFALYVEPVDDPVLRKRTAIASGVEAKEVQVGETISRANFVTRTYCIICGHFNCDCRGEL